MKLLHSLLSTITERPCDKYKRAYASAIATIESNPSQENIIEQYRAAESDMDQDAFAKGWQAACREQMKTRYNSHI